MALTGYRAMSVDFRRRGISGHYEKGAGCLPLDVSFLLWVSANEEFAITMPVSNAKMVQKFRM